MAALPIQLAVFDVAGTTVLDGDAVTTALADAIRARGIPVSRREVLGVMGLPKPVAIRQLLAAKRPPLQDIEAVTDQVHEDFRVRIKEQYRRGTGIGPPVGIAYVFHVLRSAGIRVALDTGFSRDILDVLLAHVCWREGTEIDFTVASDEVARGRPYPDLIHHLMTRAQITNAAQVAKIGDTPSDLEEGLAAGCGLVVGVAYGTHSRAELERPGVVVIDAARELLPLVGLGS
jgi:phosphonatase-like hydrolase